MTLEALAIYDEAEGPGGLVGLKQGDINELVSPKPADFSFPSPVFYGEANDVILMSHWEVRILEQRLLCVLELPTTKKPCTMLLLRRTSFMLG